MDAYTVHECECLVCRGSADHPDKAVHRRINLLVSRLDENQRRWFVAAEAMRIGHCGDRLLSQVTGMNVETIRRGRRELEGSLVDCPEERVRRVGGGRPPVEKKIRRLRRA
ncbi:MAG: transposase [Chloroflexota bacterium]